MVGVCTGSNAHETKGLLVQEEEFGRARVTTQWADDAEAVGEAVDLCPVDCIYYVPRDQLALLEFVMKGCKREDAATLSDRCWEHEHRGFTLTCRDGGTPFTRVACWPYLHDLSPA